MLKWIGFVSLEFLPQIELRLSGLTEDKDPTKIRATLCLALRGLDAGRAMGHVYKARPCEVGLHQCYVVITKLGFAK